MDTEPLEFEPEIPTVSPNEFAEWMASDPKLVVLDVREEFELKRANLVDPRWRHAPMSQLAARFLEALPEELQDLQRRVVVYCHVGIRSAQVTAWLRAMGWEQVYSLNGGIDAYAREIDPSIPRY